MPPSVPTARSRRRSESTLFTSSPGPPPRPRQLQPCGEWRPKKRRPRNRQHLVYDPIAAWLLEFDPPPATFCLLRSSHRSMCAAAAVGFCQPECRFLGRVRPPIRLRDSVHRDQAQRVSSDLSASLLLAAHKTEQPEHSRKGLKEPSPDRLIAQNQNDFTTLNAFRHRRRPRRLIFKRCKYRAKGHYRLIGLPRSSRSCMIRRASRSGTGCDCRVLRRRSRARVTTARDNP